MSASTLTQTRKQRICELLDDLPPESLATIEQLVRFLHGQATQAQPAAATSGRESTLFHYPTVSLPLTVLDGLVGLMPPVGGDALAETEALYDTTD